MVCILSPPTPQLYIPCIAQFLPARVEKTNICNPFPAIKFSVLTALQNSFLPFPSCQKALHVESRPADETLFSPVVLHTETESSASTYLFHLRPKVRAIQHL